MRVRWLAVATVTAVASIVAVYVGATAFFVAAFAMDEGWQLTDGPLYALASAAGFVAFLIVLAGGLALVRRIAGSAQKVPDPDSRSGRSPDSGGE